MITALAVTGCGSKKNSETARIFTDEDIEILASLDEQNLGKGQTMVEVVSAPIPPAPGIQMTGTAARIQEAMSQQYAADLNGTTETAPMTAPQTATVQITQPVKPVSEDTSRSAEEISYNEKVQIALKTAGYYSGAIDGKIGPQSREAIKSFQKENGLNADGVAGPTTWQSLKKYYTKS